MWEEGLNKKSDFQFQYNVGHIESHMDILNLVQNETENLLASGRISNFLTINSFIILIIVTTPGNDSANRFSLLYYFSAMNISEDCH